MRRRLAHGKDNPAEAYGWKPFGNMDYGYPKQYQTLSSFTVWGLVTWGSFSIDPLEAAALLAGAVAWSEYDVYNRIEKGKEQPWGTGASWIHNVQAGYCWYHHFVKGQRGWPVWLGSYAEITADLGAIVEE